MISLLIFFAYEFFTEEDINKIDFSIPIYLIINGILLLFTYPLFFIIEKTAYRVHSDIQIKQHRHSAVNDPDASAADILRI